MKVNNYNGVVPVPDSQFKPLNPNGVIQPGDVIVLRSGNYGRITILGYYNKLPVTLMGEPGAVPIIDTFAMASGTGWLIRCLNITSSNPNLNMNLVDIEGPPFLGKNKN